MASRNIWTKVVDNVTGATTGVIKTDRLTNLMLVVKHTGDGVDSSSTITTYSSQDVKGNVKTAIGIAPSLTGSRDADGAIAYTTADAVTAFEIPGVHPYIWIAIAQTTAAFSYTVWIGGTEDY